MALTLPLWLLLGAPASAQDYSFPASAADYAAFYPTAYKDHGGADWNCGSITYSGHNGSDFGGGSWTGMDEGRDIVAAANGTVDYTNDGEFDRCDTGDCDGGGGFGNYVRIVHADGKTTYYAHLKQWSVAVSAGQAVTCGQKLGEMGSSGHSTGPHVHFEVRIDGSASDPFDGPCSGPPTYWVDQGVYDGLPGLICEDVPACGHVANLACGQTIDTANNAGGSSSSHASYGCGEFTYSGPEIAFAFATNQSEAVTIRVRGNSADVDLFVLDSSACDGGGAVGCSVNSDANEEAVSFNANANQTYTLVADGWEGATTGFQISAECAGVWPGTEDTSPPEDTGPPPAPESDPVETDFDPIEETDVELDPGGKPGETVTRTDGGCGCGGADPGAAGLGLALLLATRRRGRSVRRCDP